MQSFCSKSSCINIHQHRPSVRLLILCYALNGLTAPSDIGLKTDSLCNVTPALGPDVSMYDTIADELSVPKLAVLSVTLNQSQQNDCTERLLMPHKASAPPSPNFWWKLQQYSI